MKNTKRLAFWIALSAAMLSVSLAASINGMIGGWNIEVAGVPHGAVWDPGGAYLGSGVLFFEQQKMSWVGHPGLTLMAFCHAVGKSLYWLSGSASTFQHFAGKNIYWLTLASMLGMTGLLLVACFVVERVAVRILENEDLAMLAALAFATTYPALYYLNRISPESLLVIFTLLAFLWLWRYYELGDSPRALVFLALSSQAAVAAFYTKLLIVGPIILFIPFQLLCRRGVRRSRAWRDAGLFLAFAAPALLLGSRKMDWGHFFSFWFAYAPGAPRYTPSRSWIVNVVANLGSTAWAMLSASVRNLFSAGLVPSFATREGLFFASECVFLIIAAGGLVSYWRACRNRPVLLAWFLGFIALTSVPYLQRGLSAWHYVFLQLAVAAIFFSYGLARLLRGLAGVDSSTRFGFSSCGAAVVLVHAVAIALFVDLQRHNAREYRSWEAFYRAPASIGDQERVGLAGTLTMAEILQPVATYLPTDNFLGEFERYFVAVSRDAPDAELRRKSVTLLITQTRDGLQVRRILP